MVLDGPKSPPLDQVRERLVERFGEAIRNPRVTEKLPKRLQVTIDRDHLLAAATALRDEMGFHHCSLISGVDWKTRFSVVYHLTSWTAMTTVEITVDLPREDPSVDSISLLYGGANWHEREAYDLLGIVFKGHPDLRRVLLPEWWEGHPLRKDYEYDMELDKVGPMGHSEEGQDIHGPLPSGTPVEGIKKKK